MKRLIYNIESMIWNFPAISSIAEDILVEIADVVSVRLIYLPKTFSFDNFFKTFTIYLRIKS